MVIDCKTDKFMPRNGENEGVKAMEIVGIDVGYSFVKTSTQMIFPSRITQAEPMLGYGRTLRWKDKLYFVGTGTGTVSLNKSAEEGNTQYV